MNRELKPCPFCGSSNLFLYKIREPLPDFEKTDGGDWEIMCKGCNSVHIFFRKPDLSGMKEFWNGRAEYGKSIHSTTQKDDEKPKV